MSVTAFPCPKCGGSGQIRVRPPEDLPFRLMSREAAGLMDPRRIPTERDPEQIKSLIVHHNGPQPSLRADTPSFARAIQRYHMTVKGWTDLQYNAVVGRDGVVIDVRGVTGDQGAEGRSHYGWRKRYAGAGKAWEPIYGVAAEPPGRLDFGRWSISIIAQLGELEDGSNEPPTPEMVEGIKNYRAYAEKELGHDLYVDVHRSHQIKNCPGPHLANLAGKGLLGPTVHGVKYTTDEEDVNLALEYIAELKKQGKFDA